MKKTAIITALALSAAMSLTACGKDSTSEKASESSAEQINYDSSIVFAVQGDDVHFEQVDETAMVIMKRAEEYAHDAEYECYCDYENNTITMNLVDTDNWGEDFAEIAAEQGLLEFREGTDADAEVLLTNSDVESANPMVVADEGTPSMLDAAGNSDVNAGDSSSAEYCISIQFNEEGTQKFADITAGLAGSETPLSIWVDGEMVCSPTVLTAITDGNAVVSGNFTLDEATVIAEGIGMEPLPYQVEVIESNFAGK